MNITIPQMIVGIFSMFIAILGIRIVNPLVQTVLGFWDAGTNKTVITLAVYMVMVFIIYIIVYGTVMGKAPNLFGKKEVEESY